MANSDTGNDWRYYAIRFAFGIVAILLPITIGLAALTYSNLKADTKEAFTEVKALIETRAQQQQILLTTQANKVDELCRKVGEHDTLLRIPFSQRQEFYRLPKDGLGADK